MKRHAPAAARNREPILQVLCQVLPERGLVVEVASGSGEHGVWFARHLPGIEWQPTDQDPDALASIAAWQAEEALPNLRPPLPLDVLGAWPVDRADAVFCANMIHIAPWACTLGLLDGAARLLAPGAPLVTYGPYMRGGVHTAESNAAFDASLRSRDPAWGVRDLDVVAVEAEARGLALERIFEMPANNLTVLWRRR